MYKNTRIFLSLSPPISIPSLIPFPSPLHSFSSIPFPLIFHSLSHLFHFLHWRTTRFKNFPASSHFPTILSFFTISLYYGEMLELIILAWHFCVGFGQIFLARGQAGSIFFALVGLWASQKWLFNLIFLTRPDFGPKNPLILVRNSGIKAQIFGPDRLMGNFFFGAARLDPWSPLGNANVIKKIE